MSHVPGRLKASSATHPSLVSWSSLGGQLHPADGCLSSALDARLSKAGLEACLSLARALRSTQHRVNAP